MKQAHINRLHYLEKMANGINSLSSLDQQMIKAGWSKEEIEDYDQAVQQAIQQLSNKSIFAPLPTVGEEINEIVTLATILVKLESTRERLIYSKPT